MAKFCIALDAWNLEGQKTAELDIAFDFSGLAVLLHKTYWRKWLCCVKISLVYCCIHCTISRRTIFRVYSLRLQHYRHARLELHQVIK